MQRSVFLNVIGERGAGKTSLIYNAVTSHFPAPVNYAAPSREFVSVDGADVAVRYMEACSAESFDFSGAKWLTTLWCFENQQEFFVFQGDSLLS
jgi:GTPase SAR1 family protein